MLIYFLGLFIFSSALPPQKSKNESIADGSEIYMDFCIQCHLGNGEGVRGVYPPLKSQHIFSPDLFHFYLKDHH